MGIVMGSARLLVAVFLLAACTHARHPSAAPTDPFSPSAPTVAASTPTPSASPSPLEFAPPPDAPIPRDPARLAAALVETTSALRASIGRWRDEIGTGRPAPDTLVLQALFQQRICRALAADPKLAAGTIPRLPSNVRVVARTVVKASSLFHGLVRPVSNPAAFRTGAPEPAGALLGYYRQAERRFGVAWQVLAALNYVESKFGRVKSTSYAGARGPMQFIPSTWAVYAMGGNVDDPHDAIQGAANYLHRSGAPDDYRHALYAYNHAWPYVDAVLLYARLLKADIRNYFALYNWQVFVLTTKGAKRLTGPGLS
jgi:membrane-bound lytic murein transglycosylase B